MVPEVCTIPPVITVRPVLGSWGREVSDPERHSVASQKTLYPQQRLFFALIDPEDEVTEIRQIIGNDLPVVTV